MAECGPNAARKEAKGIFFPTLLLNGPGTRTRTKQSIPFMIKQRVAHWYCGGEGKMRRCRDQKMDPQKNGDFPF